MYRGYTFRDRSCGLWDYVLVKDDIRTDIIIYESHYLLVNIRNLYILFKIENFTFKIV